MGLYLAVIGSVGRQGLVLSFKPMTAAPLLGMGQGYLFSDGGVIKLLLPPLCHPRISHYSGLIRALFFVVRGSRHLLEVGQL